MMAFLKRHAGDLFGAFADSAILLPVLSLLAIRPGFSLPMLLTSSGALYLASGLFFRAPMPVQPLKSIVLTALALGAGAGEIRVATLLLGTSFLILALFGQKLVRLPEEVIRCVQWGLGLLLILQGMNGCQGSTLDCGIAGILALGLLLLTRSSRAPWLGIFSFLVFLASLRFTRGQEPFLPAAPVWEPVWGPTSDPTSGDLLRWPWVASLLLPQIALTSANSVLGTELAFRDYFPERDSSRLRPRLLFSIGLGNVLMAFLGGLPFCHGSGGLTAHVRAGARSALMNAVIGLVLICIGILQSRTPSMPALPSIPASAILLCVGILHLGLARGLLASRSGNVLLLASSLVTLATRNLLYTLLVAISLVLLSLHTKKAAS